MQYILFGSPSPRPWVCNPWPEGQKWPGRWSFVACGKVHILNDWSSEQLRNAIRTDALFWWNSIFSFIVWAVLNPLLDRTRCRSRRWAAIRLSRHREPSGHAVHGEVDRLDSGEQHVQRPVLRNSRKSQKGPYPICVSKSGNVRHRCGGGYAEPTLFLEGSLQEGGRRCRGSKYGDSQWVP